MKHNLFHLFAVIIIMLLIGGCSSEKKDFEKAKTINTIQAYKEFLNKYPEGQFVEQAQEDINKLQFEKYFGGSKEDVGYSVRQTNDGGYILAGKTESSGAGKTDVYLLKIDAKGDKLWDKTFGGPNEDAAYSIQQTKDAGFIITGQLDYYFAWSLSGMTTKGDVWLIRTDNKGNKNWDKRYEAGCGKFVIQTSDGGYIITGDRHIQCFLRKTDSTGKELWFKKFNLGTIAMGLSVQETEDNGFIIAGFSAVDKGKNSGQSLRRLYTDIFLVKTDKEGNKEWGKFFGGPEYDELCNCVQQTNDGGYILAGKTMSFGEGEGDVWLIKVDKAGNKEWDKTFGGAKDDEGRFIQQTKDDGYIVTGYTESYGAGKMDVYLLKIDAKGNRLWDKTFGGSNNDSGYSVQQTKDGGYIVAGETESFGTGKKDIYLIKTDKNGNVIAQNEKL